MTRINTDILIVGSGIAGLAFAAEVAGRRGTAILAKSASDISASAIAQGGLAAVIAAGDSFASHIADTEAAGAGLCDHNTVRSIVEEAPGAVAWLSSLGARFDTSSNGALHLHREGGHSHHRIVHTADHTGSEITSALTHFVRQQQRTHLYRDYMVLDLILEPTSSGKRCAGAWAIDTKRNTLVCCTAKATVLCTGGIGQLFSQTTNPSTATGDGIAIAYRAGAALRDLEFVQFHPTVLHTETPYLITEALRGAGAVLRHADNGTLLIEAQHPLGSLAPRDIVARIAYQQRERGVVLDTRHVKNLEQRFPTVAAHCREQGIDPTTDLIPVTPAAHYLCGGIATDLDGRTSIEGLYACGETACTGLHGANRLASNSLTEAIITARRAAQAARHDCTNGSNILQSTSPYPPPAERYSSETAALRDHLRDTMWNNVGIIRSPRRLRRAIHDTMEVLQQAESLLFSGLLTQTTAELSNMALSAHLIALAAYNRPYSIGTHYVEPEITACKHRASTGCCNDEAARATGDSDATGAKPRPCHNPTIYSP